MALHSSSQPRNSWALTGEQQQQTMVGGLKNTGTWKEGKLSVRMGCGGRAGGKWGMLLNPQNEARWGCNVLCHCL